MKLLKGKRGNGVGIAKLEDCGECTLAFEERIE